jgi:hypothetical protein
VTPGRSDWIHGHWEATANGNRMREHYPWRVILIPRRILKGLRWGYSAVIVDSTLENDPDPTYLGPFYDGPHARSATYDWLEGWDKLHRQGTLFGR